MASSPRASPQIDEAGGCSSAVEPCSLREAPGSTPNANYKTAGCGPEAGADQPGTVQGEVPGCCKPQAPSALQASPPLSSSGYPAPPHIQVLPAASTHSRAARSTRAAQAPWSGSTGSAQARLGAPHSRLPRADTERTASAPREAARTIKTSREPPREEPVRPPPEAEGLSLGKRGDDSIQSKSCFRCSPWGACGLPRGSGV